VREGRRRPDQLHKQGRDFILPQLKYPEWTKVVPHFCQQGHVLDYNND